jgi:hypothetical protein
MGINTSPIAQQSEVQKMVLYAYAADGTLAPATVGGGGGGAVSSVFGRTGAVVAAANDYSFSQISGSLALATQASGQLPIGNVGSAGLSGTAPVTISAAGAIGCATCTTNAAALTANALVIGGGAQAASALGSLGTTTTVLHGNAAGAPTFGAVSLATDVSGQLPIGAVGSAGLSGTAPITISAAGAIACPTCNTSAAAITSNVLPKGSGGAQGLANSSITDNGTTVSTTEPFSTTGGITTGANGGTAGVITFNGSTSGSCTITAPAVAGTVSNAISFSNAISSNSVIISANGGFQSDVNHSFFWVGRSQISSGGDGIVTVQNNAANGFSRLTLGPASSSFPALCPSGTSVLVGLANGNCTSLVPLNASVLSAGGFTAVSIGTPTQVYNTAQTAQSASIGATTMLANPAADRNFRFNVYVGQLAQGTTCTVAGSVAVNLIFTDPITGNTYTYSVPLDVSGGSALGVTVPLSTSAPTVANVGNGTIQFRAKASTNIQYSTTYAQGTCSSGSPTYSVFPVLEAL